MWEMIYLINTNNELYEFYETPASLDAPFPGRIAHAGSTPVTARGMDGAPAGRAVTASVFVRSSLFALGLAVSTLVFTPVALASVLLPYRFRWRAVTQWSRFNVYWLSVTCGVRCEVEGLENVPAEPAVVLARHESAWETLALQRYFAPQVWVLKRELLRIPFFGWGLATMRPIAIDRGAGLDAFEQMLSQGEERLASGCWVVVFPEGTRTAPGVRRQFKKGGARLRRPHRPPRGSGGAQRRGLLAEEQLLQVPRHHPRGHRHTDRSRRTERGGGQPDRRAVDRRHPPAHPRRRLTESETTRIDGAD